MAAEGCNIGREARPSWSMMNWLETEERNQNGSDASLSQRTHRRCFATACDSKTVSRRYGRPDKDEYRGFHMLHLSSNPRVDDSSFCCTLFRG